MRKHLNIIILAVVLVSAQACVSDRKKETSKAVPAEKVEATTLTEKRAIIEKQRVARAERRLADLEAQVKASPNYIDKSGKTVYYKAEKDPAFVGGEKALVTYLRDNLKYPQEAEEKGEEGTVFVDFVVLANGSVKEVKVPGEVGYNIDQSLIDEAVRVVSNMPNWAPGQQHGKAVDVKYNLPITFQVN